MHPTALKKALAHLKKDKKLGAVIKKHKPEFAKAREPFEALVRAIIYQQLSGKAAGTIHRRFLELYKGKKHPTPKQIAATSLAKFRSAGVSQQKAGYLHDLAIKFSDGTIQPKK